MRPVSLARTALVTSACVLATGCATIVDGTDQKIPVTSNPPGASVTVDNTANSLTPADLRLSRREEHTLLLSLPGHHSERVTLRRELSGAIFGNILLGGVVGGIADLASGASHHLEPKVVHVEFHRIKPGEQLTVREWTPPRPQHADAEATPAERDAAAQPPGG